MEDNLNFFENRRQPKFFQMEGDRNFVLVNVGSWDELNILVNERQP